ncbi:unnamed protein product [Allacma fusca]|uniref:Uncharacterized protein n=1 Tax=Allacma fusca TaxID=39272 RepID=A0A8J2L5X4_9HEXA|nr:unnamed protein product [Allacma fusca]
MVLVLVKPVEKGPQDISTVEKILRTGIYEHGRNAFTNGFPVNETFYSGADFIYHFTRSNLRFETVEHIIRLPLRRNFSRYPTNTVDSLVDGMVFLNKLSPTIIFGDQDSPVSKWYVDLSMHRSYRRSNFDAEISVSCESHSENRNCQVALHLQVLDRFGRIYSSRVCRNGFRVVSTETVARYSVPNVVDLMALGRRKNILIQDSKCQFRVILTCFHGYENDESCGLQSGIKGGTITSLYPINTLLYDDNITITTMTGVLVAKRSIFTPETCIYLHEGTLYLRNFTSQPVINLLRFNVTGKVNPQMPYFELLETLYLAHHLQHQKLIGVCLALMVANLTPGSAATVLVIAFVFQASETLCLQIKQYFIRNMASIIKVKNTTHLAKQFPRAVVEIIFGPIRRQRHKIENGHGYLVQKHKTALPLAKFLQQAFYSLANNRES